MLRQLQLALILIGLTYHLSVRDLDVQSAYPLCKPYTNTMLCRTLFVALLVGATHGFAPHQKLSVATPSAALTMEYVSPVCGPHLVYGG